MPAPRTSTCGPGRIDKLFCSQSSGTHHVPGSWQLEATSEGEFCIQSTAGFPAGLGFLCVLFAIISLAPGGTSPVTEGSVDGLWKFRRFSALLELLAFVEGMMEGPPKRQSGTASTARTRKPAQLISRQMLVLRGQLLVHTL